MRKRNCFGVISLRNALPICAIPNGILTRVVDITFLRLTKTVCAVSGRRYALEDSSAAAPTCVLNIMLNWRTSVQAFLPQWGHALLMSTEPSSARYLFLQFRQSTMGSWKLST